MGVQVNSYFKSKYTGAQIENMLDAFGNTASAYETSTAYSVGDLVLYNNALYVCTGATTGAFDPTKWQQTTLAELVENLGATYTDPNSDGNVVIGVDSTVGEKILRSLTFPGLTNRYYLPFAQYIRERLQNDPSAASFSIEIPDAEEAPMHSTVIKGKTVAQNQLVKTLLASGPFIGLTITNNGDGSITLTGTPSTSAISIVTECASTVIGHTLYIQGGDSVVRLRGGTSRTYANCESGNGLIITAGYSNEAELAVQFPNTTTAVYANVRPQCIDLSLIFTSAELTAIGTDVAKLKAAWLKKYGTPLPQYIPYDAGSLANVNGAYRLRGRNLWDEVWETGRYNNTTGAKSTDNNRIRNKNKIPVYPNKAYYKLLPVSNVFFYDANEAYLGYGNAADRIFTTPDNCRFICFMTGSEYGGTYKYDICINLSDASFNGQYEKSFNGGTIDCSTAPLNGFDDTVCDVKDFATGERTDKCGTVDLGTLPWNYNATDSVFSSIASMKSTSIKSVCSHLVQVAESTTAANMPLNSYKLISNNTSVIVKMSGITADNASTMLSGMYLCYELATPVTSTITPQPLNTQYGYNLFEPISGGVQSAEVDITYYENIAGYIDKKLAEA